MSEKHQSQITYTSWFDLLDILEQTKIIFNEINQINGCLRLEMVELTSQGYKATFSSDENFSLFF